MLPVTTIRHATEAELSTPIETIRYSLVDSYTRRIEKANLRAHGQSICAGSMHLPHGIEICFNSAGGYFVDIHQGWRDILKKEYAL